MGAVCYKAGNRLGHWGFQYYMEAHNAKAMDVKGPKPVTGDIIVVPMNNANLIPLPGDRVSLVRVFEFIPCRWLSTMNALFGAGFYSNIWGPLPFAFGRVPVEVYYIFVVK